MGPGFGAHIGEALIALLVVAAVGGAVLGIVVLKLVALIIAHVAVSIV